MKLGKIQNPLARRRTDPSIRNLRRNLATATLFGLCLGIGVHGGGCAGGGGGTTISYGPQAASVMNVITHSGATVEDVVRDLGKNPADDGLRALVQPYLAPMSKILAHAPVGRDTTRAWRDLQVELAAAGRNASGPRPAWRDLLERIRKSTAHSPPTARGSRPRHPSIVARCAPARQSTPRIQASCGQIGA